MQDPQLSFYIQFYRILQELQEQGDLSAKEKNRLKIDLAMKDPDLMNLILDMDAFDFKQDLINHVKCKPNGNRKSPLQKSRKAGFMNDSSPTRTRRSSVFKQCNLTEEDLLNQATALQEALYQALHARSPAVTTQVTEGLRSLSDLIHKIPSNSSTPQQSIVLLQEISLQDQVVEHYQTLKHQFSQYSRCLQMLKDENMNIFAVLKHFMQVLTNCDEFTFISKMHGVYASVDNAFTEFDNSIPLDQIGPCIVSIPYKQYASTFALRVDDDYFFFHQNKSRPNLIELAGEYKFENEVHSLAELISRTIKEARLQSITPQMVEHHLIDIGIDFVRCSKYLFIHLTLQTLKQRYNLDHYTIGSLNSISSATSPTNRNKQVTLTFKDMVSIHVTVIGLDSSKKEDLALHREIELLYSKYCKFIEQCFDHITYYKFFMRTKDALIFEFDKMGDLVFLSRPIPQHLMDQFQMKFLVGGHYRTIFQDETVLKQIDNRVDSKWELQENAPFDIFTKKKERKFSGFVIIFQEGWLKDKNLDGEVRQIKLQQETLKYIAKLEQSNPEIKDTIIQMFKPDFQMQKPANNVIKQRRKCIFNEVINIPIPVAINNLDRKDARKPPQLIDTLDSLEFNVIQISDSSIEKQRVVYNVLLRNGFLDKYNIDDESLCEFLSELEYKYNKNSNPFHNYDHGVNVMQACHVIVLRMELTQHKGALDELTKFALIISGLCHDVAHTGRTNLFEMNSLSQLAIKYHDKSVLEQHHASTALAMMLKDGMNFLSHIDFRSFRKLFIQNILCTDIAEHFNLLKNFESMSNPLSEPDIKIVTGMIIHTADFAGGAHSFPISKQWSFRVNQEFQAQYAEEGKNGYPQQPYMKDLHKMSVLSKSEMGFFKFIVRPLYSALSKFLEDKLQDRVGNLDQTIIEWERVHVSSLEDENKQNHQ